jgi:hypothetical protein
VTAFQLNRASHGLLEFLQRSRTEAEIVAYCRAQGDGPAVELAAFLDLMIGREVVVVG